MKKDTYIIGIGLLIFTIGLFYYSITISKRNKIACINSEVILSSYIGVKEFSDKIEIEKKEIESRIEILRNEFESALKEFEKKRPLLSESEIKNFQNELEKKQRDYSQYGYSSGEKLKNDEMEVIKKAVDVINKKVSKYAIDNGFSVVLASTPTSGLVYASEYVDITDDIVKIIND